MKQIKYILAAALTVLFAACNPVDVKEPAGKGDAVVGFKEAAVTINEATSLASIAIVFTGEPTSFPITVDVETNVPEENIRFIQQKNLKLTKHNSTVVEFTWDVDDDILHDPMRTYTFTLTNLRGNGVTLSKDLATVTVTVFDKEALSFNWEWLEKTWKGQDNAWNGTSFAPEGARYDIVITKVDAKTCKLSNLWAGGYDLTGTVDFSKATITFKPMQVVADGSEGGYGLLPLIFADPANGKFYGDVDIEATMNADNTITINNWGLVITEGEYEGRVYGAYYTVLSE